MNKIIAMISIALNIVFVIYITNCIKPPINASAESNKKTGETHSVAIITPVSHPSLELIEQGFRQTLNMKAKLQSRARLTMPMAVNNYSELSLRKFCTLDMT